MPDPTDPTIDIEYHYESCPIVGCAGCFPAVLIEAGIVIDAAGGAAGNE